MEKSVIKDNATHTHTPAVSECVCVFVFDIAYTPPHPVHGLICATLRA